MIEDMKQFNAGVRSLHPLWQLWVVGLLMVNGVAPMFFIGELAAVVTLAGMVSGGLLGLILVRLHGFTKLLGLMHLPWVPMLAAQVGLYPGFDGNDPYSLWLSLSVVVTALSLYPSTAVREYVCSPLIFESSVMMSSVTPSRRYSSSFTPPSSEGFETITRAGRIKRSRSW